MSKQKKWTHSEKSTAPRLRLSHERPSITLDTCPYKFTSSTMCSGTLNQVIARNSSSSAFTFCFIIFSSLHIVRCKSLTVVENLFKISCLLSKQKIKKNQYYLKYFMMDFTSGDSFSRDTFSQNNTSVCCFTY